MKAQKTFIKLKPKQKEKLIGLYKDKQTPDYLRKRIHLVLLRDQRKTIQEISLIVQKGRKSVIDWLKRFKEQGLPGLISNYAPHNQKLTLEQLKEIKKFLRKTAKEIPQKLTSFNLKLHLKSKYNIEYRSQTSFNQIFYKCGFAFRKPNKCYREASPNEIKQWVKRTKKN